MRQFRQVDVFTAVPYLGNPVAVVADADGIDTATMHAVARWTNLSETTFVISPTDAAADYRVRIFTPASELPFAGHPTLGTCHAWLEAGGRPRRADNIVQQCGVGLVDIRRVDGRLAFAAPPRVRSGAVDAATAASATAAFGLDPRDVVAAEWVDNGPGWLALLLDEPGAVLAARPAFVELFVGLVALYPPGAPEAMEVRGFFPKEGAMAEDPVTGSLNAAVAQWLTSSGRVELPYVSRQGTVLERQGRVHVSGTGDRIWVGGDTVTCITGTIEL